MLAIILAVIILDRLTKLLITHTMMLGESFPVLDGFVSCTYILNPGAAFGMLEHQRLFFVAITLAVLGGAFYYRRQIQKEGPLMYWGSAMFLGGAIGNCIDRIQTGMVIDFIDFHWWPIFNVADIFICTGVGLIIWSLLKTELKTKKSS